LISIATSLSASTSSKKQSGPGLDLNVEEGSGKNSEKGSSKKGQSRNRRQRRKGIAPVTSTEQDAEPQSLPPQPLQHAPLLSSNTNLYGNFINPSTFGTRVGRLAHRGHIGLSLFGGNNTNGRGGSISQPVDRHRRRSSVLDPIQESAQEKESSYSSHLKSDDKHDEVSGKEGKPLTPLQQLYQLQKANAAAAASEESDTSGHRRGRNSSSSSHENNFTR
jgi:hypothetical protein